ncbi:MAG: BamA/TamA family outer membrane protein [candidate division KSB1 bacterium]|nr:BamA/TamA family outer membrane protein [candidate division KSB1 bacterium]
MLKKIVHLILIGLISAPAVAQISISRNHPELTWRLFETAHFKIIYHDGIDSLAREVAGIAEAVYLPITADLGVTPPQKTPIVVTDYLDYSNGLATPLGHHITIWAKSENRYMTGQIKWLQAVVAHEFAHIVTFWGLRAFPGFWRELLALGFVPTWFLEGVAEYEAEKWCEHRELLLRVVAYHHQLLPYKKMTGFIGTDDIGSRLIYQQGQSLMQFIASHYGPDKIAAIIRNFRRFPISFNLALKRTIGCSENALFKAWRNEIELYYQQSYSRHTPSVRIGSRLETALQGNYAARWSPDSSYIAVVGVDDFDVGVSELYLLNAHTGAFHKVAGPYVNSYFAWSPDGKSIAFSQRHFVATGALINDLFLLHVQTRQIERLTTHARATDPHFSPDGLELVFVMHQGPGSNLMVLNLVHGQVRALTSFPAGVEVFSPQWSPDGQWIAFAIWDQDGRRDICRVRPDGGELQRLTDDPIDDRDPAWSPDGKQLAFISYRNGNPNLYLMDPDSRQYQRITDSPGGVFNPTWLPGGRQVAVTVFENRNRIDVVTKPVPTTEDIFDSTVAVRGLPFHERKHPVVPLSLFRGNNPLPFATKAYHGLAQFRPQLLLPYLDKSEAGWQPGAICLLADPLAKHTLLAAATYRSRWHGWIDYTNRQLGPTIQLSLNKTTIDHGPFLSVRQRDSSVTTLPLLENYYAGSLVLSWTVNFGRNALSNHVLWVGATFSRRNIINATDYKPIDTRDWAFPLLQGWTNYGTFGYAWTRQRPDVGEDIHPKSGHLLAMYFQQADRYLGSDLRFSKFTVNSILRKELWRSEHVLAVKSGLSLRRGSQPIQARTALGSEVIRGLAESQEGDQQVSANLEYRFPMIRDLGLKLWIMYLERVCGALFLDVGKAWGQDLVQVKRKRFMPFESAPWRYATGLELRHRFYVFGKIPVVISGGTAVDLSGDRRPRVYFRLGAID